MLKNAKLRINRTSRQIVWLVGGYIIGERWCKTVAQTQLKHTFCFVQGDIFSGDSNRSDIIFSAVDHTGLILKLESRQRIWRWLDQVLNLHLT
jgi:hypothetical protein